MGSLCNTICIPITFSLFFLTLNSIFVVNIEIQTTYIQTNKYTDKLSPRGKMSSVSKYKARTFNWRTNPAQMSNKLCSCSLGQHIYHFKYYISYIKVEMTLCMPLQIHPYIISYTLVMMNVLQLTTRLHFQWMMHFWISPVSHWWCNIYDS